MSKSVLKPGVSWLARWLRRATNDPVVEDLTPYLESVARIREGDRSSWSDARLAEASSSLRSAGPSDGREIEIFTLVSEAVRRSLGVEPFEVQWIAGLAMARGHVAELPTGEGKTLALVFPAVLHALAGRGVHVLTFNEYLAGRDAASMGPIYRRLGLSVSHVAEGMSREEARAAYAADVTYTTAKQAGFDFLRDGLVVESEAAVHRPFHAALVDEADSILIDEARIPLVIAGTDDRPSADTAGLARLVASFAPGRDFGTDAEHRNVFLLDPGVTRVEAALEGGSLYAPEHQHTLEAVHCALHARALLRRDVDYLVRHGGLDLIDGFTGRVAEGRRWPDGLQAAVEAKEGLPPRTRGRVLGQITLQHFLGLYPFVAGTTATVRTSAEELRELYGLSTVVVPPRLPSRRVDHPDVVFADRGAKQQAVVEEIRAAHAAGRPVLVGTSSVRESEALAAALAAASVPCVVLNAKHDEDEAAIVAQAGAPGAVTISTNMAGRGTDIRLGGPDEAHRDAVVALGGLSVLGTSRHESLRIDGQLRGRAGRQGDPGGSRFFVSIEDDLFIRHGLTEDLRRHGRLDAGGSLDSPAVREAIAHSQRVIDGQHFDMRRTLCRYSSLVELQRRHIADRRLSILASESGLERVAPDLWRRGIARLGAEALATMERRVALHHLDHLWSDHLAWIQDTRESIHLVSLGGKVPLDEFQSQVTGEFLSLASRIDEAALADLRAVIDDGLSPQALLARLQAPASTWTYLVNDEPFGSGVSLLKTGNIGKAAGAALYVGPLLILSLILERLRRSRRAVR